MTPKSLLRLPGGRRRRSRELADGRFERVIDDPTLADGGREQVTRLVLCSGKIYYDIAGHEERDAATHIAVARVELLYPFPEEELVELIASYPNLERDRLGPGGAEEHGRRARSCAAAMAKILPERLSLRLRRPPAARGSPGEGYSAAHKREQARIVRVALDLEDDRLEPDSSAQRPLM